MASREKRPVAPSKSSKQKANNNNALPIATGSSPTGTKKSKLAREIFEAVATNQPLPAKLEAALPRKRALQTALKRKQKAKKTLIKVKQKIPIKTLKRIADAKKILKKKKTTTKNNAADASLDDSLESDETKSKPKTAKKPKARASEEIDFEQQQQQDKSSLKNSKKSPEISPKVAVKSTKASATAATTAAAAPQKRHDSKEREVKAKRSLSKEPEEVRIKQEPLSDNSYELTIEEVIASSSMLVDANIKVESEESALEGELKGRKLVRNPAAKRGLRNGKLRQSTPKIDTDSEPRRSASMSDSGVELSIDPKAVPESFDSDLSKIKIERMDSDSETTASSNHVNDNNTPAADETNNNGCENSEPEESGPKLRSSRSKARSSDSTSVDEDVKSVGKNDKPNPLAKVAAAAAGRRSSLNTPIDSRRSSYTGNIDKMVTDGNLHTDFINEMVNNVKNAIKKEIESKIYINYIPKSAEEVPSKVEDVVAPVNSEMIKVNKEPEEEKANGCKKELSTGIGPKKDMKAEDAENTVPKVADTAKEIEKLVMGDKSAGGSPKEQPVDEVLAEKVEAEKVEEKKVKQDVDEKTVKEVEEEEKKVKVDEPEEKSLCTESETTKDSNIKQSDVKSDDTKKQTPTCPTRKSTRSTAGRSSIASEVRKSISFEPAKVVVDEKPKPEPEIIENVEKSSENEVATKEEKVTNTTLKADESVNENKTVPESEVTTAAPEAAESSISKTEIQDEKVEIEEQKMEVDDTTDKNEETLESLSRDVEKLVKEDMEKVLIETENTTEASEMESSDLDMRLIIDDETPSEIETSTSDPSKPANDNKEEGCDEKASSADVPMAEASSVQETSETDTEKSKEKATESTAEVTETVEEQKETRRVLRTRGEKQKKAETAAKPVRVPTPLAQDKSETKVNKPDDAATPEVPSVIPQDEKPAASTDVGNQEPTIESSESSESTVQPKPEEPEEPAEPQIRTRRSREAKRPVPIQSYKSKRGSKKHDTKKSETQQTKEETMLDNEVATINENNRSTEYLKNDENRGVSASNADRRQVPESKNRSKSENDVRPANATRDILKTDAEPIPDEKEMETETDTQAKEMPPKYSDEASTSEESSSSENKILETPEERAKKEAILRHLGLESWEKVHERQAKKDGYTGTLKIRIQKDGGKSKSSAGRSRSPIKMVLKQGRTDGEECSEYYTIQKEGGSSLGESSSGANRKISTNPRQSCDEEGEEVVVKGQSLVIPEKSSSFSIHPGRLCADNCCYCHGKFGSLDTPMHLAQMKSDERRWKILENEIHLTKDSCLCDACYRHVDRKANMSPTMQLKPQRHTKQQNIECMVIGCTEPAINHVKRRWLLRIKHSVKDQLAIKWDSVTHNTLMTDFCPPHYQILENFLRCTLCKNRLTKNMTYPVGMKQATIDELNENLKAKGIPASLSANAFFCKLCKYFAKINLKYPNLDGMSQNSKSFYKKYRKKLLYCYDVADSESDEEPESGNNNQSPKKLLKNSGNNMKKLSKGTSGSELASTSKLMELKENCTTSEKSSPEPQPAPKEIQIQLITKEPIPSTSTDTRFSGIESAIEKLKKRKALDTSCGPRSLLMNTSNNETNKNGSAKNAVEILAMDKEITLTRVPKRPRLSNNVSNDITPVVQRLGANPSISVRTLFPGEEEMNLHANVEFNNVREVTPQGWEKCATMIQYDRDTKLLWQELQRPYGNQSSFLRHLVLLEKYYRAGDLILAPHASRNAINYSTSVQNRLISYEGPEKMDEPVEPPSAIEYNNSRRLSRGYVLENRSSAPSTSTSNSILNVTSQLSRMEPSSRVMKLTPGVSIIKKPPPNLQRLNTSNSGGGSGGGQNGSAKRKESIPIHKGVNAMTGGKVIQLTEPDFKRLQNLKRQKQMMTDRRPAPSPNNNGSGSNSPANYNKTSSGSQSYAVYQKAQSTFQRHLLMQQEMLNQRSRGDFEPLVCDIRLSNENSPTQNLINNLNISLPKSIQVTTKPPVATSTPIPILPKIPKSLTVIPQTVARAQDK